MSEGNVPEPDSSPEKQQVEDAVCSHPDDTIAEAAGTEADLPGNNPMEVADDPIAEQPKKLDTLHDPKDTSPGKLVIKGKSPSKMGIKLTSPTKSPVNITSPIRGKRQSPSKPSKDVHSPSKKQSLEVITTDETSMEVSSSGELVAENSDLSSQASKTNSEVQKNSEVSQASSDPSDPSHACISEVLQASSDPSDPSNVCISEVSQASLDPSDPSHACVSEVSQASLAPAVPSHVCISGTSQASSDHSDPSHVCVETCIHGGARPKRRALITAHRSSEQNESSRILEQMNRFAERMEKNFSHNPECFGSGSQQEWTRKIDNTNVFVEELAGEMGHGPFVFTPTNTAYPYYFPSILQLNRMFTGLSLENRNVPETSTPQRMDTEQEPDPSQSYSFYQQEPTININQVPESTRPMEVDEVLSSSFPSWQASDVETEPVSPMEQETPDEQVKAAEPQVEPQQPPRQEYRLMRLAMRIPQMGPYVINPSHPYRHRDENMWRTAMMTAYRSERYHSKDVLDDAMSQLEREGVSQEDFFRFYHSARRIDLFRDEGVEEVRSGPEREEMTIEDKINRIIIAVGFMTVAMLYMRLYIFRHSEIETSSESSTMDSGNIDRSESEPKTDYARLREHVNIELGSSDNTTDSTKGIDSPDHNSPQEIQSPDFVSIPNRGSPVNVLVPLSQVPKRSDSPSSQGSLLVESDPSGSSSASKKGLTLRRAVLGKCHSQSLDNTSGDASPILPDEEEASEELRTFGQLMNLTIQAVFLVASEIKTWEVEDSVESMEDREKKVLDSGVEAGTGEASSNQDQCIKTVGDPDKAVGEMGDEDRSRADPASQTQDEDSKNEGMEGDVKETSSTEEKMDQSVDVSMESASDEKAEIECAEHKEETDNASGSNVVADDDSKTDDLGDNISRSGQSRKRKEHSNIVEEERLAKRGKEC